MPNLAAPHPAEKLLRAVRLDAGPVAVERGVVDPAHVEPGVEIVPAAGFVRHQARACADPIRDEALGGGCGPEHRREGPPAALAHHHDHLGACRSGSPCGWRA